MASGATRECMHLSGRRSPWTQCENRSRSAREFVVFFFKHYIVFADCYGIEVDIIEGEIGYPTYLNGGTIGKASQSIQVAPFVSFHQGAGLRKCGSLTQKHSQDAGYYYKNTSEYVQIWNATTTIISMSLISVPPFSSCLSSFL